MTLPTFRKPPGQEVLRFPLPSPGRVALIDTEFRAAAGIHACDSSDLRGLARFAPDSIVLPLETALVFADRKLLDGFELPSLQTAIIVLTSIETSLLTDDHRDLLWRAFGLPVFEQLRGSDGRVIARECEVHDGLHLDVSDPDTRMEQQHRQLVVRGRPTACTADLIHEYCDCGLTTPRLRNLSRIAVRTAVAAA